MAPLRKSIYSLAPPRELLAAANRRYLEFLPALEDSRAGVDKLGKLSQTVRKNDRSCTGFNFFDGKHQTLFEVIARGEFNISGLKNETLRRWLSGYKQRPSLALAEASPRTRADQTSGTDLQVLSDPVRQTGDRDRAQAEGTCPHPRVVLQPGPLNNHRLQAGGFLATESRGCV